MELKYQSDSFYAVWRPGTQNGTGSIVGDETELKFFLAQDLAALDRRGRIFERIGRCMLVG